MSIPHHLILHVVGPKKSGKTTLMEFLIGELSKRGYRVGAFKYSSHHHPLDKPGSDSDRFRIAGAGPAVFRTPGGIGIFFDSLPQEIQQEILAFIYRDCDFVMVESFREAKAPKIVFAAADEELDSIPGVIAVINREARHHTCPAFRPQDPRLVEFIINTFASKLPWKTIK